MKYTANSPEIWEIVKRMDEIIPKYWIADKVKNKPATYILELRRMMCNVLNNNQEQPSRY